MGRTRGLKTRGTAIPIFKIARQGGSKRAHCLTRKPKDHEESSNCKAYKAKPVIMHMDHIV